MVGGSRIRAKKWCCQQGFDVVHGGLSCCFHRILAQSGCLEPVREPHVFVHDRVRAERPGCGTRVRIAHPRFAHGPGQGANHVVVEGYLILLKSCTFVIFSNLSTKFIFRSFGFSPCFSLREVASVISSRQESFSSISSVRTSPPVQWPLQVSPFWLWQVVSLYLSARSNRLLTFLHIQ
jgi:hypothetical protein